MSHSNSHRANVLREAIILTHGDRNDQHGDPRPNHENIAQIWSVILGRDITPAQVALCMAGLKLARLASNPDNRDSYVDGAAYLAIAHELHVDSDNL